MSEIDKIKMEVEAARFEVVQAEKEISVVRLALRSLASKAQASAETTETEEGNSLKLSAIKVSCFVGVIVCILSIM